MVHMINVTNYSRKIKEGIQVSRSALFPFPTQPVNPVSSERRSSIPTALALGFNGHHHLPPKNNPNPFSFPSLLINGDGNANGNGNGGGDFFTNIEQQTHQIIETQGENLRDLYQNHYTAVIRAEEERAAKRVREKEAQLEKEMRRNAQLKEKEAIVEKESGMWMVRARRIEDEIKSLTEALQETADNVYEGVDGEERSWSSSSWPGEAEQDGLKVGCARCGKRMATVMAWPCRHVGACLSCDAVSKTCAVCLSPVIKSFEILLP